MKIDASALSGDPAEIGDNDDMGDPVGFEDIIAQHVADVAAGTDEDAGTDDDERDLDPPEKAEKPEEPKEVAVEKVVVDPDNPKGLSPNLKKRLDKLTKEREEARTEAAQRTQELSEAKAARDALEARVADMETRAADPEPDFEDNPDSWKAWAKRDKERSVAQAKKTVEPPKKIEVAADPVTVRLQTSITAAKARYADYGRFVSLAVQNSINNDPALHDRVMQADDPAEAAYRLGRELILGEGKPAPQASAAGLSAGGSGYAGTPKGSTSEQRFVDRFTGGWTKEGRK